MSEEEGKAVYQIVLMVNIGVGKAGTEMNKTIVENILLYEPLDHFCKSESPSFDSLNERFYDSDNIPKIFSKNSHGNMWGNLFKVG